MSETTLEKPKNNTLPPQVQTVLGAVMKVYRWLNARGVLTVGLVAGAMTLYVCAVGMVEAFSERSVIRDVVTLGQILLFAFTIGGGWVIARQTLNQGESAVQVLTNGALVGLLSSLPLVLLIIIASTFDIRGMFVSITRDLMEILTFDLESRFLGTLLLIVWMTIAGLVGAAVYLIPNKIRNGLIQGVAWTLGLAVMGELVSLVMEQLFSDDVIDFFYRRGEMYANAALVVFGVTTVLAIIWQYTGDNVKTGYSNLGETQKNGARRVGLSLLAALILALPWLTGTFISEVLSNVGLYILMGLGLNIAIGLAGLLDLGYVTNFAVGAYIMGVLTSTGALGFAERIGFDLFNFWIALPLSVLGAMLTGFIFAVPVLRMRGDYLAIATLGFGEIIRLLALSDALSPFIGGAQGVLAIPKINFFGISLDGPQQIYYVIFAACILAIFVSVRLNNSRTGRQWMAIREDEDVASAMGIDTAKAKLLAFTLSAATGGLAGAIFATKLGTIFPQSFGLLVSVNVLSLIIVGGMGSIPGVVVGALVLVGLPELLREFSEYRLLLYGALLVIMMRSRPEGLWPSKVRQRELETAKEAQSASVVATGD